MKVNKHIQSFRKFNENSNISDSEKLTMVFGDTNTVFKKFDDVMPEDTDFLNRHNGKVNLSYIGFSEECSDWVDFDRSYAYIDNGKLYVVVYGLPDHLKKSVEKYFDKTIEQYIKSGYGEFFETEPGCPICMVVERDGKEVIV